MKEFVEKHIRFVSASLFVTAIGFWLVNLSFTLTSDISVAIEQYEITEFTTRLLQVFIMLPVIIIYLAIAAAATSFLIYAMRIWSSREGKAYRFFTYGLLVMFIGYMTQSLLSSYRVFNYADTTELMPIDQVITYLNILITLGAFYFFYRGSLHLLKTISLRKVYEKNFKSAAFITAGIAWFYLILVFSNQYRTVSVDPDIQPLYGISDVMILLTIVIPNLISWFFGILAFYNLHSYAREVKGAVFKELFKRLKTGLGIIIFFYIFMQLINQFSGTFKDAALSIILLMLGVLLLGMTAGFIQVAAAARKLDKIETA